MLDVGGGREKKKKKQTWRTKGKKKCFSFCGVSLTNAFKLAQSKINTERKKKKEREREGLRGKKSTEKLHCTSAPQNAFFF